MREMTLSRQQIEKLYQIYRHFSEIKDFSITVEDNDTISVRFDLANIPTEVHSKKDKFDKDFIPEVFK